MLEVVWERQTASGLTRLRDDARAASTPDAGGLCEELRRARMALVGIREGIVEIRKLMRLMIAMSALQIVFLGVLVALELMN